MKAQKGLVARMGWASPLLQNSVLQATRCFPVMFFDYSRPANPPGWFVGIVLIEWCAPARQRDAR
jgi:hypothetical protein